jgi:hypothetical protein
MKMTQVREPFTDTAAKRKKFVPAVGHYKNEAAGRDRLCSSMLVKRNQHFIEKA